MALRKIGIPRVFSLRENPEFQAFGELARDILHAVHRQIHFPAQQGILDFLDKEPFAPDFAEG
jgi:hypothetical protein